MYVEHIEVLLILQQPVMC